MKKVLFFAMAVCLSFSTALFAQSSATKIDVAQLMKNTEKYVGKEVEVRGVCIHRCSHSGKKIFIQDLKTEDAIKVLAVDFKEFPKEILRKTIMAKGILKEERMDKKYLDKWEKDEKAKITNEEHDGCSTALKAQGEKPSNSTLERIANLRKDLSERKAKEGKDYLSFFHIDATSFKKTE